jgi:hypothetical protein
VKETCPALPSLRGSAEHRRLSWGQQARSYLTVAGLMFKSTGRRQRFY